MKKKERKLISIVLPVYNGEKYISDSINSVINQTYSNWELIIVNDCSEDNTQKICEGFAAKDKRITVLLNKNNLKLPKSLNIGFKHANGYYYSWTSHDNIFKPNALEEMVNVIERDKELVMVYADYTNIDSEGNILGEVCLQGPDNLLKGNVCGACFLYRADVAKEIGEYDEHLFLAEDYDYWIRLFRRGEICHIHDDLYYYRLHSDSLTMKKKARVNEQTYKMLEKNFLFLYWYAKRQKKEIEFFTHMLKRGASHKKEIIMMLAAVEKKYVKYLKYRRLKERIKNTKWWSLYRIIKDLVKDGSVYNTH